MKKRFYIKVALGLFAAATLFSSCLKSTITQPNFTNDVPVIDFGAVASNAGSGGLLQSATVSATSATNSLNILVIASGQHDYTSPTTITVALVSQATVTAYNASYTVLPASTYTISSLTLNVIPGITQRIENVQPVVGTPLALPSVSEGLLSFIINGPALAALQTANPATTYVLPLTITGASGNSAVVDQYNTVYYKVVAK